MQDKIVELVDSYTTFMKSTSEYSIVTNKIKDYVRAHDNNTIVDYYSLKLKVVDKSIYSKDAISYLKSENLNRFVKSKIDDSKIDKLVDENLLDKEFVMNNIVNEKTVLDIITANLNNLLTSYKKEATDKFNNVNIVSCIKRRESLKYVINEQRSSYYNRAKHLKKILLNNNLKQYRFKYRNDIGIVKIKEVERIYSNDFVKYINQNYKDANIYFVDSPSLLKSKSKKIDRDTLDTYKIENYQEYLYIKVLYGLFNKKFKK